jgi:hypothetical protein
LKNVKTTVVSALKADTTLKGLVSDRVIFMSLPEEPEFPCITYYEQNNSPALVGDGKELTSESVMVIDVWSKGSTTAIAQAVDDVMAGLRFVREFAGDLYETDTGVYHKSMRYRHKTTRR